MSDFKTAVLITIDDAHEGGFQKMHNDRGNWTGGHVGVGELKGTNHGISAAQFPDRDIEHLTIDEIIELYRDGYWKHLYSQIEDQLVANKLFDLGVLFGVGMAVKMLQGVLELKQDGAFGPVSLEAVNATESKSLLTAYKTAFVQHALNIGAVNPLERPYVQGYIRRINS